MKRKVLVLLILLLGLTMQCAPPEKTSARRASIVQLIANPDHFDNQRIQIAGFFVFEEENHSLYLSPDDAKYGITAGGIELGLGTTPKEMAAIAKCNRSYVEIIGVFHSKGSSQWPVKEQFGQRVPLITNIERLSSPPYHYFDPSVKVCLGQ